MKTYRVVWCRCPTNYNDNQVMFVEAVSPEAVKLLVKDHIERRGVEWYVIGTPEEYTPPSAELGRIL